MYVHCLYFPRLSKKTDETKEKVQTNANYMKLFMASLLEARLKNQSSAVRVHGYSCRNNGQKVGLLNHFLLVF